MTSTNRGIFEPRPDDEQAVDQLLAEAGFPEDAGLRQLLMQLKALRDPDVPEPSAAILALMGTSETADIMPLADRNDARKARKKRQTLLTSLAVAASLGVAGGAAAGNETIRSAAEGTISTIIRSFAPPLPATPSPADPATTAPAPGAGAPSPGTAVVPAPGGGEPPAAPAPPTAGQRAADPGQVPGDVQSDSARHPDAPAEVPEPGRGAAGPAGPGPWQEDKAPNPYRAAAPAQTGQAATGSREETGAGRPDTNRPPESGVPDGLGPTKFKPQSGG